MINRTKQKVFAVGFHKTATTSLACALYVLGYRLEGYKLDGFDEGQLATLSRDQARAKVWERMQSILHNFDAVQDIPWPVFYRELDAEYPNSKFILTTRDTEPWIASVQRHFGSKRIAHHEWIYGVPCVTGYENVYRSRYEQHNAEVIDYFADRPNDLLVLDHGTEMDWQRLCAFLECDVPPFPFPVLNQASATDRSFTGRLGRVGRRALQRVTHKRSDFEIILELQRSSQHQTDRFEANVLERLKTGSQNLTGVYTDLNRTLFDINGRIRVLKQSLGLGGSTEQPLPIDSPETFIEAWKWQALELRHIVGSINDQTVWSTLPHSDSTIHDAVTEIEQLLHRFEQRVGAS